MATAAFFFINIALLFVYSHQINGVEFSYTGITGPDRWGILNTNFSMCRNGKAQSPINILRSNVVVNNKLKPLIRTYNVENVTLVNNKFNVGVRYPDNTGGLIVDGNMYKLKQMHWHSPSEHRIDGKQYAAELHLVHVADDANVSVIAILFHLGHPDPLLAQIQKKLELLAYEEEHKEEMPINIGRFHPTEVRKSPHKYYRYVGSFTTPPCTQNVIWHILAKVRSISRKQVEMLRAPLDMKCKKNARPCQPLNGRYVELYEDNH